MLLEQFDLALFPQNIDQPHAVFVADAGLQTEQPRGPTWPKEKNPQDGM